MYDDLVDTDEEKEIIDIPSHYDLDDKTEINIKQEDDHVNIYKLPTLSKTQVINNCYNLIASKLQRGDDIYFDIYHKKVNEIGVYKSLKNNKTLRDILMVFKSNYKQLEKLRDSLQDQQMEMLPKLKAVKKSYHIIKKFDRAFTEFEEYSKSGNIERHF